MSKLLSPNDVKSKLEVTQDLWRLIEPLFPGGEPEVDVRALDGATYWEFECVLRPDRNPVLRSKGWLKFVRHKGLAAGDLIVLKNSENEFRGTQFALTAWRWSPDAQHWFEL